MDEPNAQGENKPTQRMRMTVSAAERDHALSLVGMDEPAARKKPNCAVLEIVIKCPSLHSCSPVVGPTDCDEVIITIEPLASG
jgi:hypothetical protein